MTWAPVNEITESVGRLVLFIDGVDRTFYRGVPTEINSWTIEEPFSDKTLSFRFPGITSYEAREDLPFSDFQNVDLYLADEDGNLVVKLWEGFIASETDDLEVSANGLTIECLGALYQADFFIKTPNFGFAAQETALAIATEFNLRSSYYGLRLSLLPYILYSVNPNRNIGSWNELMTGWAQEMLAQAYTPIFLFDNEQATAISCNEYGYIVTGNYLSQICFGERQRNYGSNTWNSLAFIHLLGDPAFFVSDCEWEPNHEVLMTLSWGGYVDVRGDLRYGEPSMGWKGDDRGYGNRLYISIEPTPSGNGYWILNSQGELRTYGDALFFGTNTSFGTRTTATGYTIPQGLVDIVATPTGLGYWLLDWTGIIHMRGDAASFCDTSTPLPFLDTVYVGMDRTEDGKGLWVLDALGRVMAIGDTPVPWQPNALVDGNISGFRDISRSAGGNGFATVTLEGRVYNYGDQPFLGHAEYSNDPDAGGNSAQFTMGKWMGRIPVIHTKNTWSTDWTVTVGTPGVTHTLTRDRTQLPNVFYGEGTDPDGCYWRNTKYPYNRLPPGTPGGTAYPGYVISVVANNNAPAVMTWQRKMKLNGFPILVDGVYDQYDANICRMMQAAAGIPITGVVDAQTWNITFATPGQRDEIEAAYIAPLAIDPKVEPFLYSGSGGIIGNNPKFDRNVMRIETYNNYGENTTKRDAIISAITELKRNREPGYMGTITLTSDPEEDSRFLIRAGDNILLKGYRGQDILFHISRVEVDFASQAVTLTVDSKARDQMTSDAMLKRDAEIGEPPLKPTRRKNSEAKSIPDTRVVWDCESNAGIIHAHVTPAAAWEVVKVACGEMGEVVKAEALAVNPLTEFSYGVFDREVTPQQMASIGRPDDLDEPDSDYGYWDRIPPEWGLIIAWGGPEQMAGYWPGTEFQEEGDEEGDPVPTGVEIDTSSWNFWSTQPPFLWVAIWTAQSCTFGSRFYPGKDGGFNFASVDSIANPMEMVVSNRPTIAHFPGSGGG